MRLCVIPLGFGANTNTENEDFWLSIIVHVALSIVLFYPQSPNIKPITIKLMVT